MLTNLINLKTVHIFYYFRYLFIILYTMQMNFPSEIVKFYCVVYVVSHIVCMGRHSILTKLLLLLLLLLSLLL